LDKHSLLVGRHEEDRDVDHADAHQDPGPAAGGLAGRRPGRPARTANGGTDRCL